MDIDYNKCIYMNAEKQNARVMMKPCINGSDQLAWPCVEKEGIDKDIFSIVTERPLGDNIPGNLPHSLNIDETEQRKDNLFDNSNVEGFTNMGERYIRPGNCPDGYSWCEKSQKCKQVCMNCKYNERTYGKSKEFNEGDACFPDQGVYDGIDNQGYTKCTCGKNNQYCGDNFNAQGGLYADNTFIMNIGDFGPLGNLAAY
jgi:hypothetical protein